MDDNSINMVQLMNDIVDHCHGEASVYENYSGRGMYGTECWGVVCTNPIEVVEIAATMGMSGAQMDSMGLKSIVYWPHPEFSEECTESYTS